MHAETRVSNETREEIRQALCIVEGCPVKDVIETGGKITPILHALSAVNELPADSSSGPLRPDAWEKFILEKLIFAVVCLMD